MSFFRDHLLSLIIFTPLVGALVLLLPAFASRSKEQTVRYVANGFGLFRFLATLALSFRFGKSPPGLPVSRPLWFVFDKSSADFQFVERAAWIPSIGVQYLLGVDGISALLILLTT